MAPMKLASALGLVAAILTGASIVIAQEHDAPVVEVRVWENADDPSRNYLSIRVDGGRWQTHPLSLDAVSRSGRYRYADLAVAQGGAGAVAVRLWESAVDPSRNYVSILLEDREWVTEAIPTSAVSRSGRFRYGDLSVSRSGAGAPVSSRTATPTPTPETETEDCQPYQVWINGEYRGGQEIPFEPEDLAIFERVYPGQWETREVDCPASGTPTPTPTPTRAAATPAATAPRTPTVDPAEEAALIAAAEAQYGIPIARIGITGQPIPELATPKGATEYGWRPAEPLVDGYPDRPFLVFSDAPVETPEPWMIEAASELVRVQALYHELEVTTVGDDSGEPRYLPTARRWDRSGYQLAPALAALVVPGSIGEARTYGPRTSAMERGGTHVPLPYDDELVAINFTASDRALVYVWTYDWNRRFLAAGESEPSEPLLPPTRRHWEYTWVQQEGPWLLESLLWYDNRLFVTVGVSWLEPYIALVHAVHEPLALQGYEEWTATPEYVEFARWWVALGRAHAAELAERERSNR